MTRREFLTISAAAAALPLDGRLSVREQTPPPQPAAAPPTKFEEIRRNAGYFTARGGTIGWLVNNGAVVTVDTQFPDTAKVFLDSLRQRTGGRGIDVAFNTHHHGDHTGGNGLFKEAAKRLVAHARVPGLQKQTAAQAANAPAPVVADATFEEVWSEEHGDERVSARHYGPGHTGGDAVIHFERANVAHMGDLFFYELHPRVDRPAGASIENWMKTLETVAKDLPRETIYIAGHARQGLPVTARAAELLRLRDYFDAVLTHARQAIAKGQSREELIKLPSLPGFESYQSSGTILSLAGTLGAAFEEISAPKK